MWGVWSAVHEQSIKRRKLNPRLWEGTARALVGRWSQTKYFSGPPGCLLLPCYAHEVPEQTADSEFNGQRHSWRVLATSSPRTFKPWPTPAPTKRRPQQLNRSERGGEVMDWLEPKTGGAGCRRERADRHGAGRRDRAPAAAEPGAASRLEWHRRRAGAAGSGADYSGEVPRRHPGPGSAGATSRLGGALPEQRDRGGAAPGGSQERWPGATDLEV